MGIRYFEPLKCCTFWGSSINGTNHTPILGVGGLKNPRRPTSRFASFLVSEGPDTTTYCSPQKSYLAISQTAEFLEIPLGGRPTHFYGTSPPTLRQIHIVPRVVFPSCS